MSRPLRRLGSVAGVGTPAADSVSAAVEGRERRDGDRGHWAEVARRWALVGPPLRPSPEDVAAYAEVVAPRGLILGVTPEIYRLPWPEGADVLALDHTRAMIEAVWPGPPDAAVCADWTDMPGEPASRDVAFCDGGLHLLPYPEGQAKVVENLARVLVPGGLVALRLFTPPPEPESAADVLADLLGGRVANLNVLKLRLGMALQADPSEGVALDSVYAALVAAAPDGLPALAETIGWDLDHLLAIESYRGSPDRYYFVTFEQVRDLFCVSPGGFDLVSMRVPAYDLGDLCPLLVLRRHGG